MGRYVRLGVKFVVSILYAGQTAIPVLAQRSELWLRIGTQVPLQTEVALEYSARRHLRPIVGLGLVHAPYSTAQGSLMSLWSRPAAAGRQWGQMLTLGLHPQLGLSFPFGKGHFVRLSGGALLTLPVARFQMQPLLEALERSPSLYPAQSNLGPAEGRGITLLPTATLGYGYRWVRPAGKVAFQLEVGLAKPLWAWAWLSPVRVAGEAPWPEQGRAFHEVEQGWDQYVLRNTWLPFVSFSVLFRTWKAVDMWCPG